MLQVETTSNAVFQTVYHVVWIPKYRKQILTGGIATPLREIAERPRWRVLAVENQPDHLHLVISVPPAIAVADAVRRLKGASARRRRAIYPQLRRICRSGHLRAPSYDVGSAGNASAQTLHRDIERAARVSSRREPMLTDTTCVFKGKDPNPGKVRRVRRLMGGLRRRGLNGCAEQAKQHRRADAWALHRGVYRHLRGTFGLGARIAEACRDTAYEAYASHRALRQDGRVRIVPHWRGVPAPRLDIPRSLRLGIAGNARALRTVWASGATHGDIVYEHGELVLHIAVTDHARIAPAPKRLTAIGIDFNVTGHLIVAAACDLAGTMLGTVCAPAGRLNETRRRGRLTRTALQRAARRDRVKAMKNRESRAVDAYLDEATALWNRWVAQFPAPFVALEPLTGIRAKVRQSRRGWKRRLHSWPFGSGQDVVRYKGARRGIRGQTLRAAYASRSCSRCGSRATRRSGDSFACRRCGDGQNAHLNGARNMSWRATRYILAAAGRADPGTKPGGRAGRRHGETAERQSGPDGKRNDERSLSSQILSLRWPFRASPKPRTCGRGS